MAEMTSRADVIAQLLKSYKTYYNIHLLTGEDRPADVPVVARCDFFESAQRYFLSKKAELWSARCEEFLYLFEVPHLTLEQFQICRDFVMKDGKEKMHIGPGHMYSYLTPVFVCDTCDPEALKALKRCHFYKSFRLSFYGWMDFHAALVEVSTQKVYSNKSGHQTAKTLKQVLANFWKN